MLFEIVLTQSSERSCDMKENFPLLSIQNLSTHFAAEQGVAKVVQNVSFDVNQGKTLALVGESGCGKTVTALSVMGLLPKPSAKVINGQILFEGRDLLKANAKQIRQIRGNDIAMIFQEPMTSLNPVFTVGTQIVEAIKLHQGKKGTNAWNQAIEMLRKVGIADPARRVRDYPHQMSGGMRQRVLIAMALSCSPKLLIADEPTTALDVTVQAQILDLLRQFQKQHNMSILLITHDLAVVAENADDVVVMYASNVVETSSVVSIFAEPLHPYTHQLIRSLPILGQTRDRLDVIQGNVPNPLNFPSGCKFHPRCPAAADDQRCRTHQPELRQVAPGRCVACFHAKGYDD